MRIDPNSNKILIIGDNRPSVISLGRFFNSLEYAAVSIVDHAEALSAINCINRGIDHFNTIIIEIWRSKDYCFNMLEEINKIKDRIPVIVLTNDANDMEMISYLENGADCIMKKPFLPAELEARVNSLIRRTNIADSERLVDTANKKITENFRDTRLETISEIPLKTN